MYGAIAIGPQNSDTRIFQSFEEFLARRTVGIIFPAE
jgi:hypothetical protein